MSLLEDEIKPTPRSYILGLLADAVQKANETVSRPAGYDNPPVRMLMGLLGVPAVAQTLDRLSYGEPLTTGKGMTTKVRPEAIEAAMAIAPGVGPVTKATAKASKAAAKELGPKAADLAEQYLMEQGLAKPMVVWHGSPHKFEKFDASKIGTGEGAQAYGHGLYVAESPGVAESYRQKLAKAGNPLIQDKFGKFMEIVKKEFGGYYPNIKGIEYPTSAEIVDGIRVGLIKKGDVSDELFNYANQFLDKGSLYKIDLPDEAIARMLDWDKKFVQQPENVQKAITKYWDDNPGLRYYGDPTKMTGEGIYGSAKAGSLGSGGGGKINRNAANEAAAMDMRYYGIPGIRYLDQGSRGVGQGTSNFVIFPREEELLRILERNGIPIESLL